MNFFRGRRISDDCVSQDNRQNLVSLGSKSARPYVLIHLLKLCSDFAQTLLRLCSNFAQTLLERSENAGNLRTVCSNFAQPLLKHCSNFAQTLLSPCSNIAQTLLSASRSSYLFPRNTSAVFRVKKYSSMRHSLVSLTWHKEDQIFSFSCPYGTKKHQKYCFTGCSCNKDDARDSSLFGHTFHRPNHHNHNHNHNNHNHK